ncbi:MAG TPA: hypothetical protein PLS50_05840 [Candidatus Dojkabacteria bacterium]|nr:hypothetical protein [Candidatus Dojkabacteria bacterium]
MKPKIFELRKENEIIAYGCIFQSGKCIMEWCGENPLIMVWESFEQMKVVSDIMKATICL